MRLIGVAIVVNESDAIEAFVRHNLQFLDRLHLIGKGSVDNTLEIVRRLQQEGLPLELLVDPIHDQLHARRLTRLLRSVAERERFDFAAVLDGDEFILAANRAALERELSALPPECCALLPWVTYVPKASDDWAEPDVLRRIRHRRAAEPSSGHCKVIVPYSVCTDPQFELSIGNHYAMRPDRSLFASADLATTKLAHLPVRSPRQILSKALLGEWTLRGKLGRGPHEGTHWAALARRMVQTLEVTPAELERIAADYVEASPGGLVFDPIPNLSNYHLSCAELIDEDPLRRVVRFADAHFERLAHTPFQAEGVALANTLGGVLAHLADESLVSRSLMQYGEWAAEDLALLAALVGSGARVLDVGAGVGVHAVALARLVGASGAVYAVEPRTRYFRLLCTNAALNGLEQLHAYDGARGIADRGEIGIADALARLNLGRLSPLKLIKLDGGGSGVGVLLGLAELIARDRPWLFIENAGNESDAALISRLFALDYRAWWHVTPYFNPGNYFRDGTDLFAELGRPKVNILAGPRATATAFEGLTEIADASARWQDAPVLSL
jgi:hypothetical protein